MIVGFSIFSGVVWTGPKKNNVKFVRRHLTALWKQCCKDGRLATTSTSRPSHNPLLIRSLESKSLRDEVASASDAQQNQQAREVLERIAGREYTKLKLLRKNLAVDLSTAI